jgi:glucose-6-phosphate-specific signal transduction histidine kinase
MELSRQLREKEEKMRMTEKERELDKAVKDQNMTAVQTEAKSLKA